MTSMEKFQCTLLEWVQKKPSVIQVLKITKSLHKLFGEMQFQTYPRMSQIFITRYSMEISRISKPKSGKNYIDNEYSYLELNKLDKLLVISNYLACMLTGTLVHPRDKIENLKKYTTYQRLIDFVQKCQKDQNMKVNFDKQIDYLINNYQNQYQKKVFTKQRIEETISPVRKIEQYTKLKEYDRALKYIDSLQENVKNNWRILKAIGIVYESVGFSEQELIRRYRELPGL